MATSDYPQNYPPQKRNLVEEIILRVRSRLGGGGSGAIQNLSLGTTTATTQDVDISDGGTSVTLPSATTSNAGLQSASDKTKLNGIASGATSNVGNVNSGSANRLTYYSSSGTTVSELHAITASRALVSDLNGLPVAATATTTEINYLSGLTSNAQTQLNGKAASSGSANYIQNQSALAQSASFRIDGTGETAQFKATTNVTQDAPIISTNTASTGGGLYNWIFEGLCPNITTGNGALFLYGRDKSTNNSCYFAFGYQGLNSNNNFMSWSFFNNDNLMRLYPLGVLEVKSSMTFQANNYAVAGLSDYIGYFTTSGFNTAAKGKMGALVISNAYSDEPPNANGLFVKGNIQGMGIPVYASDAAAGAGGLTTGMFFQTGGALMIKQ